MSEQNLEFSSFLDMVDFDALCQSLKDINNILKDNSQTLEIQEDNLFCIEVSSINEIPKIISILTENNIEIIEVTQQRSSLQDIFMSI